MKNRLLKSALVLCMATTTAITFVPSAMAVEQTVKEEAGTIGDTETAVNPEKPLKKDSWKKNRTGWWYCHEDGSYRKNAWEKISGKWYHFDNRGYMQTGWLKTGGKWYYLSGSGAMQTGWAQINGVWYYLKKDGSMHTGWVKNGNAWFYMKNDGSMITGDAIIQNDSYYFLENGKMASDQWVDVDVFHGWFEENEKVRKYFMKNGKVANGIIEREGEETLFSDGEIVEDEGWILTGDNSYYVDDKGKIAKGLCSIEGEKYYFQNNGQLKTGWYKDSGKWYYIYPGTNFYTQGRQLINNRVYYFYADGHMASGEYVFNKDYKTYDYYAPSGKWIPGDYKNTSHNAYSSSKTWKLFLEADKKIGSPYVYATQGPKTFDCSGFMWWLTTQSGIGEINRYSADGLYRSYCEKVRYKDLKIGDYIFFDHQNHPGKNITHVGMYVGDGLMIHASGPVGYERVDPDSYWYHCIYACGRLK